MRILICGDREWSDLDLIKECLNLFRGHVKAVVHGGARGADKLAGQAALELKIELVEVYHADWSKYGRAAGPVRNQKMLDCGEPDIGWAFHDHILRSKGTRDMLRRLRKAGKPNALISHEGVSTWKIESTSGVLTRDAPSGKDAQGLLIELANGCC
jgi:hypothetical protein